MTVTPGAETSDTRRKRANRTGLAPDAAGLDFRALADASMSAIVVLQGDRIVYANRAAEGIVGYTMDEMSRKNFFEFVHPGRRDAAQAYLRSRQKGEPVGPRIEVTIVDKAGREHLAESYCTPIEYGGQPAVLVTALDITERKAADEELRKSEENYRRIINTANEGIWMIERNTLATYVNQKMSDMLGYAPEEMHGRKIEDFVSDSDKPLLYFFLGRHVHGVSVRHDFRFRRKDGRHIWCIVSATPVMDDRGNFAGGVAMITDITERKHAEEALRESEEKLRLVADFTYDWEIWIGQDGRYNYVSPSCERITGYRRDEFYRDHDLVVRMIYPDDKALYEQHRRVHASSADGHRSIDYRILTKDGEIRNISHLCQPVFGRDGEWLGTRVSNRDITGRKQAEKALMDREALLESIFRSAPVGIGVVKDRIIVKVNEQLCQMAGYSQEELLGRNTRLLYSSDDEYEYVGSVMNSLIAERGRGECEMCLRRKDGTIINVLLSLSAVYPGDISAGATFTALDITGRKRAEDELKEAKAQAELYLDLLSHDINNLHQIALGYLEMARDAGPGAGPDNLLDKPIEVLQRSSQLIRNVRKLRQLRDSMLQTQLVDLVGLLAAVQCEFGAVPGKAITLNLGNCGHCYVRANELLHDVFANLVSNAIRHTGDRADIVIELSRTEDDGHYCRVSVEDNGPGIPDDSREKIFNRLQTSTSKARGMGLGLYLVKSLVDSFGGKVWVEDRVPGDHTKGAKFVVMLPVA